VVYLPLPTNSNYHAHNAAVYSRELYPPRLTTGLYYKNATHQLTNITETHEKV